MKLLKELDLIKDLIDIQNINDNIFFKRCLVRYLHPAEHNPARIREANKDFARKLPYIKFPVIFTKLKKRIVLALAVLLMKTRENIQSVWQKSKILRHSCMITY